MIGAQEATVSSSISALELFGMSSNTDVTSVFDMPNNFNALIDETVASCAPIIFRKSHKTAPTNSTQIFSDAKRGLFIPASAIRG